MIRISLVEGTSYYIEQSRVLTGGRETIKESVKKVIHLECNRA